MQVNKAIEIIKDGLVSDPDHLRQIQDLFEEVSNSSYLAGLQDNDETPSFTAYGSKQDW